MSLLPSGEVNADGGVILPTTMPKRRTAPWKGIYVRIEPSVYTSLRSHLWDPTYLLLPPGAVQTFINLAIRNELARRGLTCAASPSSSSTPSTGTDPTEESTELITPLDL